MTTIPRCRVLAPEYYRISKSFDVMPLRSNRRLICDLGNGVELSSIVSFVANLG
jgi:hypothetical protein